MSVFGNAISESNKAVTALEGTPSASGVERGNSLIRQRFKTKHTKLITTGKFTSGKEVGRASLYKNYQTKEDVLRQWAERLNNELNDIRINDDPSLSVLYDI